MSNNSYVALTQILQSYMIMSPVILVHGAGVVVAITRWNRHPKISRLALAGFGIALLLNIVMPVINGLLTSVVIGRGPNAQYFGLSYPILSILVRSASAVLAAVGYALLILAVFSERQQWSSDRSKLADDEMNTNAR